MVARISGDCAESRGSRCATRHLQRIFTATYQSVRVQFQIGEQLHVCLCRLWLCPAGLYITATASSAIPNGTSLACLMRDAVHIICHFTTSGVYRAVMLFCYMETQFSPHLELHALLFTESHRSKLQQQHCCLL